MVHQTLQAEFKELEYIAADFLEKEDFESAAKCYRQLVVDDPYDARAYYNLAIILHDLSKFAESLACYEQAIKLGYHNPARANLNTGMNYLKMGDFKRGFHYVDLKSDGAWRLGKNFAFNQEALSHIDLWEGQSLEDKTILIYCEQGFGDNIQFVRYIPQVRELGGRIIFSCYDQLYNIFKNSPILKGVDVMKGASLNSAELDFKIPLLSLPRVLEATIDNIPHTDGYLSKTHCKDWNLSDEGMNVALVWESSGLDTRRSIPLETILPLCELPNVNMVSIQKGSAMFDYRRNPDIKNFLPSLGERIRDFSDTADILSQVDLLISTDTAPIHMGGALGIPTWGLLHFSADWRWFREKNYPDTSPWYESVRIYRQKEPANWGEVVERVKIDLKKISSP
tara:strand:- start:777 stop:1964 length:1188 start_codon:yes stop_codon:yes gene_type:complete